MHVVTTAAVVTILRSMDERVSVNHAWVVKNAPAMTPTIAPKTTNRIQRLMGTHCQISVNIHPRRGTSNVPPIAEAVKAVTKIVACSAKILGHGNFLLIALASSELGP